MNKSIDMIGKKFGRWTVLERKGLLYGRPAFLCVCECGDSHIISGNELRRGKTKGCSKCSANDKKILFNNKSITEYSEYNIYQKMINRCYNIKDPKYKNYGGRGIKVCTRWLDSFINFITDMGKRPSSEHSIDRIDNNGNYEPENCRWATYKQQANNRRPRLSNYITKRKDKNGAWQVVVKGKFVCYTKTKEEAIKARDNYIKQFNIEVRLLNDK